MTKTLLLFDIDGTLMITCGAGSRCIRRTMRKIFGDPFEWTDVTAGLLDPQIYLQLTEHNKIEDPAAYHEQYREILFGELKQELAVIGDDIKVMPGIREALQMLRQREDVVLGLLTGNYGEAAKLKLAAADIDLEQFQITCFAEHGQTRDELVRHAMEQYETLTGEPAKPDRVVIIGDTPRDIACAHACGCTALSVATGRYSTEQLRDAGGDLVVADLKNYAEVFAGLLKEADA